MQNDVLGHEMLMKNSDASRLALFQAPAPPVGSVDVITPPWVKIAAQSCALGQSMPVTWTGNPILLIC